MATLVIDHDAGVGFRDGTGAHDECGPLLDDGAGAAAGDAAVGEGGYGGYMSYVLRVLERGRSQMNNICSFRGRLPQHATSRVSGGIAWIPVATVLYSCKRHVCRVNLKTTDHVRVEYVARHTAYLQRSPAEQVLSMHVVLHHVHHH